MKRDGLKMLVMNYRTQEKKDISLSCASCLSQWKGLDLMSNACDQLLSATQQGWTTGHISSNLKFYIAKIIICISENLAQ